MNKIVTVAAVLTLSALTGSAFAAREGAYVGLGLGGSRLETPKYDVNVPNVSYSEKRGGLGERVFYGYNFNRNFGAELSLNNYAESKYEVKSGSEFAKATFNQYALHLVGKAYLPFDQSGFNLYALGGAAYVTNKVKYTESSDFTDLNESGSEIVRKLRPVVGVGASYDVNECITTSLEYTHTAGQGNVKNNPTKAIADANMLSLNVGFNL